MRRGVGYHVAPPDPAARVSQWVAAAVFDTTIETSALQALALAASSDENTAVDVPPGALMPARPQAYVRVFADENSPMALCSVGWSQPEADQAAARSIPLGCLGRVLRGFGGRGTVQGSGLSVAALPGLVEQLTAPELQTLALLAAGCRTRTSPNSWSSATAVPWPLRIE